MFSGLETYNSFCPSELIDVDVNNNISVNLTNINLNVLSSDLLSLDLSRKCILKVPVTSLQQQQITLINLILSFLRSVAAW